jgi:hypothetical protein
MSERLKEHDWKSCVCPQRCTAGSNPALSAIFIFYPDGGPRCFSILSDSCHQKNREILNIHIAKIKVYEAKSINTGI